jgi:hypothetical protein
MAMGSGAFLVQADRYLAERLVESWEAVERSTVDSRQSTESKIRITPEGKLSTGAPGERLIPDDADERMAMARRLVAERCLYGVDKNPLAVEMAKLSLWLVTAAKDRPFTFLDHALKCGDSLVGADAEMFERWTHSKKDSTMPLFEQELRQQLAEARQARSELESFEVNVPRDADRKQALLKKADEHLERIRQGCDVVVGARLSKMKEDERAELLDNALIDYVAGDALRKNKTLECWEAARRVRAFHWQFEFPEVFERGGFDAFIGNPPFVGGSKITAHHGETYRDFLVEKIAQGIGGRVDLCAYFFLRAYDLMHVRSAFGLLATNSIAQGEARDAGLSQLLNQNGVIYRAIRNQVWPGTANVWVSVVWIWKGTWKGISTLDNRDVSRISMFLTPSDGTQNIQPYRLSANAGLAFRGTEIRGEGFILSPKEAQELIDRDERNRDVLFPYLGGDDLNSRSDQSPSRWVINFHDWDRKKSESYAQCFEIVTKKVKPYRSTITKQIHEPDYWKFWDKRLANYKRISQLERVLALAAVSPTNALAWVKPGIVFQNKLILFPFDTAWTFVLLQSSIHWEWVRFYTSTLGSTTLNYSPTDCFETFPFPADLRGLETIGEQYHEYRRQIMLARQEGLTATYNRFHNPDEHSADIARLRELHVEMDRAVAAAYGWDDLNLGHGFHETAQGIRYTISVDARREVLARLLRLNHERYEEKQRSKGAEEQGTVKSRGKKKDKESGSTGDKGKKSKVVKESREGYGERLL